MTKRKLVVLSGAGISAESGVPVYRGDEGVWNDLTLMDLASVDGWEKRKSDAIGFYNDLRNTLAGAKPNIAHSILAKMENDFDVTILTQNVDDLHERAGSNHIVHLHGDMTCVRPENTCNVEDGFSEKEVTRIGFKPVYLGDTGGKNQTQLRPHIVFFGEPVYKIEEAEREVKSADIFLVIGTSLKVYPVAFLCQMPRPDCEVYIIDPSDLTFPFLRPVVHIKKKATEGIYDFAKYVGFDPW